MKFEFSKDFVLEIALKLLDKIRSEKYVGYDPYDALNSPILNFFSFNNKYLKIAYIQAFRRSPINFRPLFGIKRGVNPKALGLLLEGISILSELKILDGKKVAEEIVNLLRDLRSPGYVHYCWGYNFPWQSRVFYLPPYTPTIVNTSFIGNALFRAFRSFGLEEYKEIALDSIFFVVEDINRNYEDNLICFSYTPFDNTKIHNANLLGGSLLLNGHGYLKDKGLEELIHKSYGYTLKYQNGDGSWYYAQKKMQNWIDNFHTGFVLDSLLDYYNYYPSKELKEKILKGFKFYKDNFFEDDKVPKYYHNKTYPIDIHSISQSIITLVKFSQFENNHKLLKNIFNYMLENFYSFRKNYFYYRRGRLIVNRIDYLRWAQAWSFKSLCHLVRYLNEMC